MALRTIVKFGDSALTRHCRPVTDFNQRLHILLEDMAETMMDAEGVGLSAPQVGILRRAVVVLDTTLPEDDPRRIIELVNPEIVSFSGEQTDLEGCLSYSGNYGLVTRPAQVRVRAQDRYGAWFEREDTGLTARAFCHEIDHLDGILFTAHCDHILSPQEMEDWQREKREKLAREEEQASAEVGPA